MDHDYDIVIVGAGIHGAGITQITAAMGYKVLLLEKDRIASGTSSRSSKLIHGGLRYLETAQLKLVRESLQERDILLRIAPTLVKLVPFYIPIYRTSYRNALKIRAGLFLYFLLGNLRKSVRFKSVKKRDWQQLDGLRLSNLTKVFQYYDGQTDDQKLTQAVVVSAKKFGAEVMEQTCVSSISLGESECTIKCIKNSSTLELHCKIVVNATGPWVNHLLKLISPNIPTLPIETVQGSHIIVEGTLTKGIYYVESPIDRRVVFIMPWYGKIMIGTTEKMFKENPDSVRPTLEEMQYLLDTAKHYFPMFKDYTTAEIISAFAGLRVLPKSEGSAFNRSRETIIHLDREKLPRVISVYGGKLTGYRCTAYKVASKIQINTTRPIKKVDTAKIPLE